MWIVDLPIPDYGQSQAHRDAWPELCRVYREMTGKTPPDEYTEQGYAKLYQAVEEHVPATFTATNESK